MKVLLKYPTRQRPEKFAENIKRWEEKLSCENSFTWLISLDEDDRTMDGIHGFFSDDSWANFIERNPPNGKIAACNANVNDHLREKTEFNKSFGIDGHGYDMIWLVSDDMKPEVQDFDLIIQREMETHYPDWDGAVHINDGLQGIRLCTFSCMGMKYYERFNYLYHPQYQSTHCDDEFTQIAWANRRMIWIPEVLVRHEWIGMTDPQDELHKRNHALMNSVDAQTYQKRARAGFPKGDMK